MLITARRGLTTLARHDHVPGKHPFRPLLSLVSGIGTRAKLEEGKASSALPL